MESGARDERHRLLGAYQGIALGEAQRVSARHGGGLVRELTSRYDLAHVLLQPLKDGYYLVLLLTPEAVPALSRHRSSSTRQRMNERL